MKKAAEMGLQVVDDDLQEVTGKRYDVTEYRQ